MAELRLEIEELEQRITPGVGGNLPQRANPEIPAGANPQP